MLTSGKHVYIRSNAPLTSIEIRKWIPNANKVTYDHHFQDSPSNIIKMVNLITNLAVLNRMLAVLYEVGVKRFMLPSVPPHSTHNSKWVFLRKEDDSVEATRNSGTTFEWDRLDESELKVCKK